MRLMNAVYEICTVTNGGHIGGFPAIVKFASNSAGICITRYWTEELSRTSLHLTLMSVSHM